MVRITQLAAVFVLLCTVSATAQPITKSGMLLGIYAFPNYQGLRVTSTMPGYSAHGVLFSNDVLKRVTADGIQIYPTRTLHQLEFAKDQIGPNRQAALEIFRPGVGNMYLWVEFRPVGGGPAAAAATVKAEMWSAEERPGAERLFQRPNREPKSSTFPQPGRPSSGDNAADLFNR